MNLKYDSNQISIHTYHYMVKITREQFFLIDSRSGRILIDSPSPLLFWPSFHPQKVSWKLKSFEAKPSTAGPFSIILLASPDRTGFGPLINQILCFPEHFEFSAFCEVNTATKVAFWNLLSPGAKINLFHVHHWRNRHGHPKTYETYNLYTGGQPSDKFEANVPPEMVHQFTVGTELSTFSTDWQFAPRPSLIFVQRDSVMLGIGSRDLPQGFGLEMKAAANKLEYFRLNYGGENGFGHKAKETVKAPRFYLWLDHNKDIWQSVDHYVQLLSEDGMIPKKSIRNVPHWWFKPIYTTWVDQGSDYFPEAGFMGTGSSAMESFNEKMLNFLLKILEREKLFLGSIIIDAGWYQVKGQWKAHPEKFPRLKEQIERIHSIGLKAILWMAPFDVDPSAKVKAEVLLHPEWLAGGGKVLNKNNWPLVDYSNPRVQKEYVEPMVRYLISDGPGCLNADGLTLDFMADKIHPEFPVYDRNWRGEEPFIKNTVQLLYDLMKEHKSDAVMQGCTAHPFFIGCQDLVRTYDVPASQFQQLDRCEMIRHFNPGNLVNIAPVERNSSLSDLEENLMIAQHGNMLFEFSNIVPAPGFTKEYYDIIRKKLKMWNIE